MAGINQSAKKRAFRLVAVNDRGALVGESHPRAKLTDHEVDLILQLRDEGLSLGRIARIMETSKSCIQHICSGYRRADVVVTWRRVSLRR